MTSGERAWINKVLPVWRLKLEDLIMLGRFGTVIGLESAIGRLEARLAEPDDVPVAVPALGVGELIAMVEERLGVVSPRPHPHYPQFMINAGPIMRGLQFDIVTRLAELKGEAQPAQPEPTFAERMRAGAIGLGPPVEENEGKYDVPSSSSPKVPDRTPAAPLDDEPAEKYRGVEAVSVWIDEFDAIEARLDGAIEAADAEAVATPLKAARVEPHEHALLKSYVERRERLEDEMAELRADRSELMKEVKSSGFDREIFEMVIRRRRLDKSIRDNIDTLLELYEEALGMRAGSGDARPMDVARDARLTATDAGTAAIAKKKPTTKDLAIAEAIGWAATRH